MKKLPHDAFEYYFSLGLGRSYQTVADHYSVSKRAVTGLANRESWQRRLLDLEAKAREAADKKKVESIEAVNERHLKALRLVQMRAIETLSRTPIESSMDATRALAIAIREERLVLGEPSDRTAISVEETIRKEYERWMTAEPSSGEGVGKDGKVVPGKFGSRSA